MQIVIEISEDSYEATCNGCMLPPHVEDVVQGIKNGIPLPKGHGDLIDVDSLDIPVNVHDGFEAMAYIEGVDPIIRADKAEGEE